MADDIVNQIRAEARKMTTLGEAFDMLRVADEIERLQAQCDLWKECATAYKRGGFPMGDQLYEQANRG